MNEACIINDDCERVPFDLLMPEVVLAAQGIGSDIAAHYIRSAVIALCERSKVLQQDVVVVLQACVPDVIVEPLCPDLRIVSLHKVCGREVVASTPCPCEWLGCRVQFRPPNILHLYPAPSASALGRDLQLTVSVAPKRDACDLPSVLAERYGDTIVAGALAKLFRVPNTPFHDLRAAVDQDRKFEAGVTAAGLDRLLGYGMGPIRIKRAHARIV